MKKWNETLVGAQLVSISDEHMIVMKNNQTHVISFELDQGDCCGFARLEKDLFFEPGSNRNPVIVNVKVDEEEDTYCDSASTKITFYGEYQPLAAFSCECGSGSGWHYGASVTLVCKSLNIDDVVCHW